MKMKQREGICCDKSYKNFVSIALTKCTLTKTCQIFTTFRNSHAFQTSFSTRNFTSTQYWFHIMIRPVNIIGYVSPIYFSRGWRCTARAQFPSFVVTAIVRRVNLACDERNYLIKYFAIHNWRTSTVCQYTGEQWNWYETFCCLPYLLGINAEMVWV